LRVTKHLEQPVGRNQWQRFVGPLLLVFTSLASACGTFEASIERTATVSAAATDSELSQGSTPTSPAASATPVDGPPLPPTPSPAAPISTVSAGETGEKVYTNSFYNISLSYPGEWEVVPGYSEYGDKLAGQDGFFIINGAGGGTIDEIVGSEANHRLRPYGANPTIEEIQIAGQPARFIWPSDDAQMENQSALIVQYPKPVLISGNSYSFFILYADQAHLRSLSKTLRFTTDPDATAPGEDIWTASGTARDTLVAVLAPSVDSPSRFGDIATMRIDGTALNPITSYNYNVDPVLSPDGQRIAYRSVPISITSLPDPTPRLYEDLYNVWVITVDGTRAWQLTQSEEIRSVPIWSPDSRRVAFSQGDEGELVEVEVDTQIARTIINGAFAPKYRPNGDGIAYITADGGLDLLEEGAGIHTLVPAATLPPNTTVNDFDWFPDGHHLVYTLADDSGRRVKDLNIGVEYSSWSLSLIGPDPVQIAEGVHDMKLSSDGRIIAALRGSGFGDACLVDSELVFLLVEPDFSSSETITIDVFDGYPQKGTDQSFYPFSRVIWASPRLAMTQLSMTCTSDRSADGHYVLDPLGRQMAQVTDIGPD
jgi:hypothetical protein